MVDQPEPRPDRPEGSRGDGQNSSRRPKVRIGPKHRRPDAPAQQAASGGPRQPAPPRSGGDSRPEGAAKPRRHRRRKGGGRRPEAVPRAAADSVREEIPLRGGAQVLPPVQDDLEEIPSGTFNVAEPDETDSSDPGSDVSAASDFDSAEGGEASSAPESEGGASGGAHPTGNAPNRERERRRRRKRRDRPEPPPVDKTKGFWWAEQWIRSFEMLFPSNASRSRLAKGRTYARRGQVVELEVGPNGILARVQGSRPRPYQVRLELNRLRRETWGRILHHVAGKAAFQAQLLEGNLPAEIEELFFAAGARLFPHGDNDVRSRCNCPDPVAPCKHVAALNYAFADALQRDPFLLFALRGKSRDQFLQDLRDMRGRDRSQAPAPAQEDLGRFWRMGRLSESVLKPLPWNLSSDPARLVQSLGEPDLEGIREGAFLSLMEGTYRQVSEAMRRLPKDA